MRRILRVGETRYFHLTYTKDYITILFPEFNYNSEFQTSLTTVMIIEEITHIPTLSEAGGAFSLF